MAHEAAVDYKDAAYRSKEGKWQLVTDLMGGTDAMRSAGAAWLPKDDKERPSQYESRLSRSFCHGWYRRAIKQAVSKPFQEEITLPEDLTWKIEGIEDNIDGEGRNLTQFGKDLLFSGAAYGMAGVFVDYPVVGEGLWMSDYQRKQDGILPYFRLIPRSSVYGVRGKTIGAKSDFFEQIRIYETGQKQIGDYGEEDVERIRVVYPDRWELHEKMGGDNEYKLVEEGVNSLGYVPFYPFYTGRTGFMEADPPLYDLAETELAHWQSYSDHRAILSFARLGILHAAGFSKKEMQKNIVLGPMRVFAGTDKDSKLKYVEYEGKALEAGVGDLERLERMMENQSVQPFVKKQMTATEKRSDDNSAQAEIYMWIRALEDTLTKAFHCAADWVKDTLPEDFAVNVFSEFSLNLGGSEDLDLMSKLYMADKMPADVFWSEAIRRNLIPDTWIAEEIAEELGTQGPTGFSPGSEDMSGNFEPPEPEEAE